MGHLLYLLAKWWLGVLPVNDASRRSFDETLADWRREAAKAGGLFASFVVSVRAMFSVIRCVAGVSLREVMLIRRSGVLIGVFLWTVGYLLAMTLIIQLSSAVVDLSVVSRGYFLVSLVAFIFPVALLLATGLGRARQPGTALGAALVALLVSVPLLGWALPIANRAFMVANPWSYVTVSGVTRVVPSKPGEGLMLTTMSEFRGTMPVWPPNAFRNDLTVAQLSARVVEGPQAGGWNAIRWLSFFGAYLMVCVLAPILASVSRRLTAGRRYALIIVTAAVLFVQPWRSVSFGEFSITWWLGAFWIPVAWLILCLIATTRLSTGAADATPYVTSNRQ